MFIERVSTSLNRKVLAKDYITIMIEREEFSRLCLKKVRLVESKSTCIAANRQTHLSVNCHLQDRRLADVFKLVYVTK